jgi:hypothetical protein
MPQVTINILVPTSIDITTTIDIQVEATKNQAEVKSALNDALVAFLDQPTNAGITIALKDVYDVVNSIDGIETATVTALHKESEGASVGDIDLVYNEVSAAGTININATGGII